MSDVVGDDLNTHDCARHDIRGPPNVTGRDDQRIIENASTPQDLDHVTEHYNMYEMDAYDQVTSEWAQEPELTLDGSVCQGCLLPLITPGVQWRICRCSLPYCIACARGPCNSCCVIRVWVDEHEQQEAVDEETTMSDQGPTIWGGTMEGPEKEARPKGPEEIHRDRCRQLDEERAARKLSRAANRELRKEQIRTGRRPRREKEKKDEEVIFITTNATCHSSLKREIDHGGSMKHADYILIQEHGLSGEHRSQAENWATKQGFDAIIDQAYLKKVNNGGEQGY
jgi:hypothetical protein